MARLVAFEEDGAEVLLVVREAGDDVIPTGLTDAVVQRAETTLSQVFAAVSQMGKSFRAAVAPTGATTAELEFGLELNNTGKLCIVESSTKATMKVKLAFQQT